MTSNDDYVLEILLENGYVTAEQVEQVKAGPVETGKSTVDAIITAEVLSEADILGVLAAQLGMEYVSLIGQDIDLEVRGLLSVDIVRRYRVIPLYRTNDIITVAMSDPLDYDSLDSLRCPVSACRR